MPFWRSATDHRKPPVRLEHVKRKWFKLEDGFLYKVPGEPDIHEVPGGASTDLASVPWRLWWLVASYGRHTRATLLHDALVDPGSPVSRTEADRVFFVALEEGRRQSGGSITRHWLIWLAVSLFGTMREEARWWYRLFVFHLLAFWLLVVAAISGGIPWIGVIPYVDVTSWLSLDRVGFGLFAAIAFLIGFAWTRAPRVNRRLRYVMWPLAVFWVPVLAPALISVELAVRSVQVSDALGGGGGPSGGRWSWPEIEPWRLPAAANVPVDPLSTEKGSASGTSN